MIPEILLYCRAWLMMRIVLTNGSLGNATCVGVCSPQVLYIPAGASHSSGIAPSCKDLERVGMENWKETI